MTRKKIRKLNKHVCTIYTMEVPVQKKKKKKPCKTKQLT